jgi:hypothetical protein
VEQEDTEVVAFTEQDKKDFSLLEKKVEAGKRQAFEALRTIRQRQLWRLIRNDEAEQLYKTFVSVTPTALRGSGRFSR